jgi:hypothetical protein
LLERSPIRHSLPAGAAGHRGAGAGRRRYGSSFPAVARIPGAPTGRAAWKAALQAGRRLLLSAAWLANWTSWRYRRGRSRSASIASALTGTGRLEAGATSSVFHSLPAERRANWYEPPPRRRCGCGKGNYSQGKRSHRSHRYQYPWRLIDPAGWARSARPIACHNTCSATCGLCRHASEE